MKQGRLWLARLLMVVLSTLVALKASDFAIGWLRNTRERHLLRLPANANQRHRSTEFDYIYTTNSRGLRGPERPLAKPPGTTRVAVLGDSFVAGFGVPDDDVFTVGLEQRLAQSRRSGVEVINLGRTGSSTIRELDLYTRIGRQYSPDIVVLAYFLGNDLREVVEEQDERELRAWHPSGAVRRVAYALCPNFYLELAMMRMSAEAAATWQPRSEGEILAYLARVCQGKDVAAAVAAYKHLPDDVRRGVEQGVLHQPRILPACYDPGRLRRALDPDDSYFERAWPRTERHLELLDDAAGRDGAEFVVVIIPDAVQVDAAAHQFAAEIGYDVDPAWLTEPSRTGQTLAQWCRREGVLCLNLVEEFRHSSEPLYFPQDGHFNSAGHARTAELLATFLEEQLMP